MAAKYNLHGSFRLIVRSTGGRTLLKSVKSKLTALIKKDAAEDSDDNSNFSNGVIFNEQDLDDEDGEKEDEGEEEEEEEEVEVSATPPAVAVAQERLGAANQSGFNSSTQPQMSTETGTRGFGAHNNYDSVPQAWSAVPVGYAPQQPSFFAGSIQRRPVGQQHSHTTGEHSQIHGQTAGTLENKPRYQAYNVNSPPATPAYQAYSVSAQSPFQPNNSNREHIRAQSQGMVDQIHGWNSPSTVSQPQTRGWGGQEHAQAEHSAYGNRQSAYGAAPMTGSKDTPSPSTNTYSSHSQTLKPHMAAAITPGGVAMSN
jgi:hypothetical protein